MSIEQLTKQFEENGGNFGKYKISELFDVLGSKKIYHSKNVAIQNKKTKNNYPYVVRSALNNGIKGYISEDVENLNPANTITFAQDTFICFYQKDAFYTGNKIKILKLIDKKMNKNIGLYLISTINKSIKGKTWGTGSTTDSIKNIDIYLPTINNKVDYKYMDLYINIIKKEKISKIDNWIENVNFDINNVLKYKDLNIGQLNASFKEQGGKFEEKKIDDLFNVKTSKGLNKNDINFSDNENIDFIGRTKENNGIQGHLKKIEGIIPNDSNIFSLIQIGDNVMQYREKQWYSSQNIFQMIPLDKSFTKKNIRLYIITCVNKSLVKYSGGVYDSYPTLVSLKNLRIVLPVINGKIAYKYMEIYIALVKKAAIADIIKNKNEKIELTKKAIAK